MLLDTHQQSGHRTSAPCLLSSREEAAVQAQQKAVRRTGRGVSRQPARISSESSNPPGKMVVGLRKGQTEPAGGIPDSGRIGGMRLPVSAH